MVLAQQPVEVQGAIRHHSGDGSWPAFITKRRALYPYTPDMPAVLVEGAPLHETDLELGQNETITGVELGDSVRWEATPAASGDPTTPTPHVIIKAHEAGIATNGTIFTTKRIYRLKLRSYQHTAQESIGFYFPDEVLAAMHAADTATVANDPPSDPTAPTVDPSRLNFAYRIDGPALRWRPVRAFDDGTRTWIEMPQTPSPATPTLLGDNGIMLNYRVRGSYYIVDSLFSQAELVAGVGRSQDRVTITRSQ
jgi:type IV secretion system protein VirB9